MKLIFALTCLGLILPHLALAETQASLGACHPLKYDSYFVAQNVKDNLKRINPNLGQANFASHFLLLRAELTMETLYLIASCETGEFFHEKISSDQALFTVSTNQVDFKNHDGETTHYEWDGKSWIKGEELSPAVLRAPDPTHAHLAPDQKASSGAPAVKPSLVTAYDGLFASHASEPNKPEATCAKLDYSSFFRAQNSKTNIENSKLDPTHANFAGHWLLIKTESLLDAVYLIADCSNGKFSNETLNGNLLFKASSNLVVGKSTSKTPELSVWANEQWLRIPDPVQNKKETVKNTLYGEFASSLAHSLPNPKHLDQIRFEELQPTADTQEIFNTLSTLSLKSGFCRVASAKKPICEVETQ